MSSFDERLGQDQGTLVDPPGNYDPELLHPILRERLQRVHARYPLWVASGHRDSEEQGYLYDLFLHHGGAPANPPGTSNHEAVPYDFAKSLAADIHPNIDSPTAQDYKEMQKIAKEEKLNFLILSELWHAQPVEVPAGYWTGLPEGF